MKTKPPGSIRTWQLAVACIAFSAAALVGCDKRDSSATMSSSPASAASR